MSVKNAKKRQIAELSAIYHTIYETLSSQGADANILDVYVLYDFVSILLMQLYAEDAGEFQSKSRCAATLYALVVEMQPYDGNIPRQKDILPLFFDYDKLYYDTNAIDAAMTTARCTKNQKAVLWPSILECIAESQKKTTIGADASVNRQEYV
jgi:hypothetical protein